MSATRNPLLFDPARETVTLYPGSIEAQLAELFDKVGIEQAREEHDSSRRSTDGSKALELAEQHDALADAHRAQAVEAVLQEIPDTAVREIRGEHPPREGNDLDAAWEANRETFSRALAREMLVEPKMTPKQLDEFFDKAPARHIAKLTAAALRLINDDGELPKLSAVSVLRGLTASG